MSESSGSDLKSNDLIFIHVPKTGGRSVRKALEESGLSRVAVDGRGYAGKNTTRAPFVHARARDYAETLGRERWSNALRFTVLRDPFDRLVSCWAVSHLKVATDVERFREWVAMGRPLTEKNLVQIADGVRLWLHTPQVEWLESEEGELLVPHVIRFENLRQEYPALARRIGAGADLGHVKPSRRLATDAYYNEPAREYVREVYARDFELRRNHA